MHIVQVIERERAAVGGDGGCRVNVGKQQLIHRRVVVDEGAALFGRGGEHGHLDGLTQLADVGERAGLPRGLQRPGLVVKQRAQGGDEALAVHRVELAEGDPRAVDAADVILGLRAHVEEEQVEQDGGNRADGHAGGDENLRPLWEGRGHVRLEGHQHGQAQGGGDDGGVAAVGDVLLGNGLQARPRHVGKQRQGGAAEHGGGDGGHDGSGLRQQAQDDHEAGGGGSHPAGLHAGEADQTNVLRKAGIGEGVHDAAEHGGQAVGADGAHHVVALDALLHNFARREDVTGGFHHGDDHDDDEGQNRHDVEARGAEVERGGHADGVGFTDAVEGSIPQHQRHARADDEAQKHGQGAKEAAEEALDHDDDGQRAESVGEVPRGGGGLSIVDEVIGGDRQQGRAHD